MREVGVYDGSPYGRSISASNESNLEMSTCQRGAATSFIDEAIFMVNECLRVGVQLSQ